MKKQKQTNVVLVTIAIFVATFMTAVEGTIVSTAMPTIVGSLEGLSLMNWVVSIYLLTNAMMTPIYGKLADRIGRKPIFMFGAILFIIGSSLCGLAQSMEQLIVFRAIQGVGAGAIMPIAFTIIADIYPFEKRAKILGLNGAAWGVAGIIGPLLGGFIVEKLSWHWIFFINVPVGIITTIMMYVFLVEKREVKKAPIDYLGSITLMIALLSLLYGFQVLGENSEISAMLIGVFAVSMLSFILFVIVERRATDPIIPLSLFNNRAFVIPNVIAALVSGFLIGVEMYIPMWMQGVLGLKAAMGGFAVTPMSITWVFGSFIAGRMIVKYATKFILTGSILVIGAGAIFLALAPETTDFVVFLLISALLGIGFGITITTTTVTVQNVVPQDQVGVATSFNTLARTLGQTVMVSIYGIVLNMHIANNIAANAGKGVTHSMMDKLVNPLTVGELNPDLVPTLRDILYSGLHGVYFAAAITLFIALVINLFNKKELA
ncbi:MDR family MFS transporter [Isobaculum melis]|uniref:Drug resistance transporter, EmrB/QacA subfamily n=1 Tax=Isobaculum melis TaxID=142588 RepID=A0A1H9TQ30_9LACT|nr:MDR family MFS transporter [Isobaculum melis]SER99272.1 drug resistance transporter, EmrB/QacA subfamily [Isobaculum melis]